MKTSVLFILLIVSIALCPYLTPVFAEMHAGSAESLKVKIISPRQGERVQGKISIEAVVSHPEAIDFVDFYFQEPGAKDRYSWKDYSPPYFWGGDGQMLDTTLFDDGPASVVAFCHSKNMRAPKAENRVHFTIDNGKPRVKILAPENEADIAGNVIIRVNATDPKGIKKEAGVFAVYIYVDGGLLRKFTNEPFQTKLNACLLAPGRHAIRAVVEDSEGLTNEDSVIVNLNPGASSLLLKE
jgi:hypothetical protein